MKIAILHRYPREIIKETNAAFPYLEKHGIDVLTFKTFDRINQFKKFWKSILWIFYSPFLVFGKRYDILFLDDSYPFYPALVKLVSMKSKVIIRLGDFHLMYNYSGWLYEFLHYFEKIGWKMADNIISISEAMRWRLAEEGFLSDVVLDPVDPKDFPYKNKCISPIVMFHGVLTKNKNVDVLLDAARQMPDIDFIIVGDGPDLMRLRGIAPINVFFLGWKPFKDIHKEISTCAVGVALRSDNPGNEYVVTSPFLQYGVMGKPCLVTRRKVFGDYEWQFTGAEELVDKLKVLLKKPWEEGQKLRTFILENHDAEKKACEIWEILTLQS